MNEKIVNQIGNRKIENVTSLEKSEFNNILSKVRKEIAKRNKEKSKITVSELFEKSDFNQVIKIIRKTFDAKEKFKDEEYESVFLQVINQKPGRNDTEGFLAYEKNNVILYCMDNYIPYGIDMLDIGQLSGLYVYPESLKDNSFEELAAHFLNEFGWLIPKETKKEIFKIEEEIKSGNENCTRNSLLSFFKQKQDHKKNLNTIRKYLDESNLEKIEQFLTSITTEEKKQKINFKEKIEDINKKIENISENKTEKKLFFDRERKYFFQSENNFRCVLEKEELMEFVDCIFEETNTFFQMENEEIIANFILELEDLNPIENALKFKKEYNLINRCEKRRKIKKTMERMEYSNINELSDEELKSVSPILENIKRKLK